MTIYAIVNDILTTSSDTAYDHAEPVWTLISASGILQGGNPYFVPDFDTCFEGRLSLAVRIGKLGKGIAERFAERYVEAVAPAVVFVAAGLMKRLRDAGLPWTPALSYDKCLAIGKFGPLPFERIADCECSLEIHKSDSDEMIDSVINGSRIRIEKIIEAVSRDNTLKTGDILLVGLSGSGPRVSPGQRAILKINGEESTRFNIR